MKSIYSLILVVCFAFVVFFTVSLIGEQALLNNNLDADSINKLAVYDDKVENFSQAFDSARAQSSGIENYEPDANLIDEFIKEYSEAKDTVDQFLTAVNLIYKLPDLLIMSIPFVDEVDLGIFRDIIWFLIGILVAGVLFEATFQRKIFSRGG